MRGGPVSIGQEPNTAYDDLLLYRAELMKVPELAAEVCAMFDHVLVDEYQDTNTLQGQIVLASSPAGRA